MKILVIDPGTWCGWAYYEGENSPAIEWEEHVNFGCWDLNPARGESVGYKYIKFVRYLESFIRPTEKPDIVYYEQVERHAGTSAAHTYGAIVGHLQSFCDTNKIPYKGIPVQVWKKFSIGNGNAKKDKILEEMKKLFPKIQVQDEADALGILKYVIEKELC